MKRREFFGLGLTAVLASLPLSATDFRKEKPKAWTEKNVFDGKAKVQKIVVDMATTALPPISTKRDLPKKKAGGGADKSKEIYASKCAMCHDSGAAGAPVKGDKKAWVPRIKQGMETLYKNGISGKGAMPPKGGAGGLSDAEFKKVVDFIVNSSK